MTMSKKKRKNRANQKIRNPKETIVKLKLECIIRISLEYRQIWLINKDHKSLKNHKNHKTKQTNKKP